MDNNRVFPQLTKECERTTILYALGKEKKEIAEEKCRSLSTITNQIQTAFLILDVRNGRELAIKLAEQIANIKIDVRSILSIILLCIYLGGHFNCDIRRHRRLQIRRTDTELIIEEL